MSLIPSESTSFPDLLGRRLGASQKSNWRLPALPEVDPAPPLPKEKAAPPEPKPLAGAVEPAAPVPAPKPVAVRAPPAPAPKPAAPMPVAQQPVAQKSLTPTPAAPPQPSPVKLERRVLRKEPEPLPDQSTTSESPEEVKVRLKTPAKSSLPAPVRPHSVTGDSARAPLPTPRMPMAKPRQRPRPVLQPRDFPIPPLSAPNEPVAPVLRSRPLMAIPPIPAAAPPVVSDIGEAPYHGDDLWDTPEPALQRRRRSKLVRFAIIEVTMIGLMSFFANMALASRAPDDSMGSVAKILTIALAVASAVVPILFYGLPETLPRSRRWPD